MKRDETVAAAPGHSRCLEPMGIYYRANWIASNFTEHDAWLILSDSCSLVSVADEVFYPVQIIGDSVSLQRNHHVIMADWIESF